MELKDLEPIFEKIESKLAAADERAEGQIKEAGKVSTEIKNELSAAGVKQREMAEQLPPLSRKVACSTPRPSRKDGVISWSNLTALHRSLVAIPTSAVSRSKTRSQEATPPSHPTVRLASCLAPSTR